MSYYSLHCHTEYSNLRFLDSINKLKDLIDTAISLNLKGVAISEHESLSGWIKAIKKKKKFKEQGSDFKIFLGDEIYLVIVFILVKCVELLLQNINLKIL